MAHEIEQFGDLASFASHREDAWHGLGTVVDEAMTAQQALDIAHLSGWNLRKEPLVAHVATAWDDKGNPTKTEQVPLRTGKRFVVVRDNPFTGAKEAYQPVGGHYDPVQNEDLSELLDTIVGESGAHYETAASLRGGAEVFLSMKLPNHIELAGGTDTLDMYLIAWNTHDGQGSFRFAVSPIRPVCKNTVTAALKNAKQTFKGRHVKGGARAVIQEARETLGLTFKFMDEFEREAQAMIEKEYTDQQFTRLAASLYPTPKGAGDAASENQRIHRANLTNLFRESPTMDDIRGTRWAAYNALTEYTDHVVAQRNKAGDVLREARALSVVTGQVDKIKQKAWSLLSV